MHIIFWVLCCWGSVGNGIIENLWLYQSKLCRLTLTKKWSDKIIHKSFFRRIAWLNHFDGVRVTDDHRWPERPKPEPVTRLKLSCTLDVEFKSGSVEPCLATEYFIEISEVTTSQQERESWILDSGFQVLDSGFFVSGTWIKDSNH